MQEKKKPKKSRNKNRDKMVIKKKKTEKIGKITDEINKETAQKKKNKKKFLF